MATLDCAAEMTSTIHSLCSANKQDNTIIFFTSATSVLSARKMCNNEPRVVPKDIFSIQNRLYPYARNTRGLPILQLSIPTTLITYEVDSIGAFGQLPRYIGLESGNVI